MFLYIVEQDVSHRFATKIFRHDVTIVKRIFRQILIILNRLYLIFVVLLINDIFVANHIRENKKFWFYFKNCVETLNEIHIHVYVSNELQQFYKNRKKYIHSKRVDRLRLQYAIYLFIYWMKENCQWCKSHTKCKKARILCFVKQILFDRCWIYKHRFYNDFISRRSISLEKTNQNKFKISEQKRIIQFTTCIITQCHRARIRNFETTIQNYSIDTRVCADNTNEIDICIDKFQ